jgi:acetyl-CoA carboxylase biotin carboxyl carrier protein
LKFWFANTFEQSSKRCAWKTVIRLLDLDWKTALPKRLSFIGAIAVELKDIKAIIDLMKKNDLSVFEMEKDGFRLKLQKGAGDQTVLTSLPASIAVPTTASAPPAPATADVAAEKQGSAPFKDIVSPMVGTVYRGASPEGASFVDVGTEVSEETVVCIIEAMKVMNEIKAETKGVIAEVVAENGRPVQFGQVLFRVR